MFVNVEDGIVNVEIEEKYWESFLVVLLDNIVSNMDKLGFETNDFYVDDDIVVIDFGSQDYVDDMMKEVFIYQNKVNGSRFVRETLWEFMKQKCLFEIDYSDCNDVSDVVECGLCRGVILTFPTEHLPKFNELFFEVFPKGISNSCNQ